MKKQIACIALMALLVTGCSRDQINYQVAEAIGTVGKYDNNEPVETPQMRTEREHREQLESEAEASASAVAYARTLADGYYYDEALAHLSEMEQTSEIQDLTASIEEEKASLVTYHGEISHLSFPNLIADSAQAFGVSGSIDSYTASLLTVSEFQAILESLYNQGYVLVDISDIAEPVTDSDKMITTMEEGTIRLPEGKKPIMISQDNLNYKNVQAGRGLAERLVLEKGEVKALYTDDTGKEHTGDYDLIPVLNTFVEEHPDFPYKGARGIVSVSGADGVFGYDTSREDKAESVKAIAKALTGSGWRIASASYSYKYLNDMSLDQFVNDLNSWDETVGAYTGDTEILIYPYGAEVKDDKDKLNELLDRGIVYMIGLYNEEDLLEIEDYYMRQTRRVVDGSTITKNPEYYTQFFDVDQILSDDR